jgi:hypothetical protein
LICHSSSFSFPDKKPVTIIYHLISVK